MSKFLGAIHFWLYNKIQFQEELTAVIAMQAAEQGLITEDKYSYCDTRPLDAVIDEGNIHNWLQERIHSAESRFAELIAEMLGSGASLDEICKIARNFGRHHGASILTAAEGYKLFNNSFVNGMPCDGVNKVTTESDDVTEWTETVSIHREYWKNEEDSAYYAIRLATLNGMIADSGFAMEEFAPKCFRIRKVD